MRLLECDGNGFKLTTFRDAPDYAILSHTWGPDDQEVTYKDVAGGTGAEKTGYEKIRFCGAQAKRDGLRYFWVDTCCIDKSNNNELATAINSMFRWYQNATRCYVYLSDVEGNCGSEPEWEAAFLKSRWFTRGWTLQELLAPSSVEFFTKDGRRLGDKRSLEKHIHKVTSIAIAALRGIDLTRFDTEERFKWAETRQTTQEEDWAYCLLGIFGVFMPLIYGEGMAHAVRRLRKEIAESANTNDKLSRQRGRPPGRDTSQAQLASLGPEDQGLEVWQNRGTTSTEFQPLRGKNYQHSSPSYYIPLSQNQDFIERNTISDTLKDVLFVKKRQTVAVVGLGGIGKTQVALQVAYWAKEKMPEYSVFWLPAFSDEGFERACAEVVGKFAISKVTDDEDPRETVRRHLSSETVGKWLLVIDNADDANLLFGRPDKLEGISKYLPRSEGGLTLFTTRSQEIAVSVAKADVVDLDNMNLEEAKELWKRSLIRKDLLHDEALTARLLHELNYIPLAITQAAAYINIMKLPIAEYLELLLSTEKGISGLMRKGFPDNTRYPGSKNAVAATWSVSFNQIRDSDKVAADLLSFISYIEPEGIPQSLLPHSESPQALADAVGILCAYSFLTRRGNSQVFDMHSLVHLATQTWVQANNEDCPATMTIEEATRHLSAVFPTNDYTNRELWGQYLPHTFRILQQPEKFDIKEKFDLYFQVGQCLRADGRTREAVKHLEEACQWRDNHLPEEHPVRLASLHALAITYIGDGQAERAIKLLEHVVARQEKILAKDHPDWLVYQHNLASAYRHNGQVKKTIKLLEHTIAHQEKILPKNHPNQLALQHTLAIAYQDDGQVKRVIELLEHVIACREKTLAEDHPYRLASQHNLAIAYRDDGQVKRAIELLEHIVACREKTLAEDHPYRLASQHNLAIAYRDDGQVKRAIELLEHIVARREKTLAKDHPDRLTLQQNLARAYRDDGQIKRAIKLLEHVVARREKTLAKDHPDRLTSQHNLARAYRDDGQIKRAIELFEYIIACQEETLAENHPSRLASQHSLAIAYQADGQVKRAIELLEHVVARREKTLAEDHPDRRASQQWLTYLLQR